VPKLHHWFCLCVLGLVSSTAAQNVAEQQVTFTYTDARAKAVFIAGEFNHWSTSATPMKRDDSGKWTAQIALRPGEHAYKFFVDGHWTEDSANPVAAPDGFGGKNSMITVRDPYADNVVSEKAEIESSAGALLARNDFAKLEEMASELRQTKGRFTDGLWKLPEFYRGLTPEKAVGHASDWERWFKRLDAWHEAYPKSITQPVVLAAGWLRYARAAGREQDESKRRQRINHARETLDAAAKLTERCPHWAAVMQDVAEAENWSREQYLELLDDAATREPTYYNYYFNASWFRPLLGDGGWTKFAEMASEKFDSAEGLTVYTRVAWSRSENYGNIFKETPVQWSKMKQGFLDIEKTYPLSRWNLNAFCRFAVLAGDRETASKLFARLGDHGDPDWQGYARYALAKEWADPATPKWRVEPLRTIQSSSQAKDGIQSIAFSPDGTLLAAGTDGGKIVMWDPNSGDEKWRQEISDDDVMSVAFSPDGLLFASGSGEGPESRTTHRGEVRVWSRESAEQIATLRPERGAVWSIAFSSDGKTLAFAGGEADHQAEVTLYDFESKHQETMSWTKGHDHGLHAVAISPDGKFLATDCYQSISVFDLAADKMAFDSRNTLKTFTQALAFSPDGKTLISAGTTRWDRHDYEPGGLVLWNTANWKVRPVRAQTEAGGLLCVALSPDGKLVAAGGIDHAVHVWETEKLEHHISYIGHDGIVQTVAFSPDGKSLASGSLDGTVKIWTLPVVEAP
jgi:WD40 repeat protein